MLFLKHAEWLQALGRYVENNVLELIVDVEPMAPLSPLVMAVVASNLVLL